MRNKTLIWIIGCMLFGIATILLLGLKSNRPNTVKNGFVRVITHHNLEPENTLDIKYSSYYVAGGNSDHIYLGNYTAPAHLVIVDHSLADSQHVTLIAPKEKPFVGSAITVTVDFPDIYATEGTTPTIFHGTLPDPNLDHYFQENPHTYSTLVVPMSSSSFAIRTYDKTLQQNILAKISIDSPRITYAPYAIEKQIDGIFCTDGMLHYDPVSARLTYVYFYRNQFVSVDTSMNVIYRGEMIDTVSNAKIQIDKIKSADQALIGPSTMTVNGLSCVSDNLLFVNSALMADNEDPKVFDSNAVFDVYDLRDGQYNFSFYLSGIERKKTYSLRVFDKTLVIIQDHYLITYNLELLLTSELKANFSSLPNI